MKYQFKENDYVYTGNVNITNELKKLAEDNGYATYITDEWSTDSNYLALSYIDNKFTRLTQSEIYVFKCLNEYRIIPIDDFKALVTGKLPKYWIIDCNEKDSDKVIKYVNNKYRRTWDIPSNYVYFGIDGNSMYNSTNKWNNINQFQNNPFLLPVEYVLDAIEKSKSLYILNAIRESKSKHEFKIGDKVKIPKTKSRGCDIAESFIIKHANQIKRDYLYIANIFNKTSTNNEIYVLSTSLHNIDGDWFSVSDLELYEEPINEEPINEELISNKLTNMQTITREQLKQIHDIACVTWKIKLLDKASKNPLSNNIDFTDEEVIEMFNAATSTQSTLLNKLFINPKVKLVIYKGFDCVDTISSSTILGIKGNSNNVVYAKHDNRLIGSIVKEENGYILRLANGNGSYGYHPTIENCIEASLEFNHKFFIL